jgi:transposase InsO family protein
MCIAVKSWTGSSKSDRRCGSIRQMDLINLLRRVNQNHELKGVILRNDNGSQFIAHSVRNFLKSSAVKQEFTHVATPEENSYIDRAAGAGFSQHSGTRCH